MMRPALLDIVVERGDDFYLSIRLRQRFGDYIDLTGCTILAQARANPDDLDEDILIEFDVAIDDQTTNKGGLTLSKSHDDTATLSRDDIGGWDLQVTHPGTPTTVITYVRGRYSVEGDYTR